MTRPFERGCFWYRMCTGQALAGNGTLELGHLGRIPICKGESREKGDSKRYCSAQCPGLEVGGEGRRETWRGGGEGGSWGPRAISLQSSFPGPEKDAGRRMGRGRGTQGRSVAGEGAGAALAPSACKRPRGSSVEGVTFVMALMGG